MTEVKILQELVELENKLRNQTNDNILMKRGLTEQITEFQKPVVGAIEKLNATSINEGSQTKELALPKQFSKAYNFDDVEIDSNLNNLTEATKPKIRFLEDGTKQLIIHKKEIPSSSDGTIKLPGKDEIPMSKELVGLLLGDSFDEHKMEDLNNYLDILKYAGVNSRSKRFKALKELTEGKALLGLTEGKTVSSKGDGLVPVDLTDKTPIDLFMELRKLKAAKQAGNNNTLARANVILDRLKKLNSINKDKYRKMLSFFVH